MVEIINFNEQPRGKQENDDQQKNRSEKLRQKIDSDNIVDIILALDYLRKEAKRKNNEVLCLLIDSVFRICIITHNDIFQQNDIKDYEAYKKFISTL